MPAIDQLLKELESLRGPCVDRESLEEALLSLLRKECRADRIRKEGGDLSYNLEALLGVTLKARNDPEASPKLKRVAGLVERAIAEMRVGSTIQ
jgi:hypothetical protein